MKTRDEILEILCREAPELRERYDVAEIALFGSYARGEQSGESDVDIAVSFNSPPRFADFLALREELSGILGERVDLVTRAAMKPLIRARAEAEEIAV